MKKLLSLFLIVVFATNAFAFLSLAAKGVKSTAKYADELIEYVVKSKTDDLARYGGEKGIRNTLAKISKEAGENFAKTAVMYSKIYGPDALKAISTNPQKVIDALNRAPANLKRNIISAIVGENKMAVSNFLKTASSDFLLLEAKHPSCGLKIARLGDDAITPALNLSERQVFALSKRVPALEAVKNVDVGAYSKVMSELKSFPQKTVELLERNPKVLLAGAALTAYLSTSDETKNKVIDSATDIIGDPIKYTLLGLGAITLIICATKARIYIKKA